MKVNANGNPSIPVQESEVASVKDGTSNTLQVGERAKAESLFAKDSFESLAFPKLDGSGKETALRGEATSLKAQDSIDLRTKTRRDEKVIEDLNVKHTFMDYTDDDCM